MKNEIKKPFLYKYRLYIGYTILMLAFLMLLIFLPSVSPGGINQDEINSVVQTTKITKDFIIDGNIINLPYILLQKASIHYFGLNLYSIKLPSIIIGALNAFFMILLLNRWFKNDVAIIGSVLTTLSAGFLTLACIGTPIIMYVFWLTFILWIGSTIVGKKRPNIILTSVFALSLGLSLYTPQMIYVAAAIVVAGLIHPHLRFSITLCKPMQIIIAALVFVITILPLGMAVINNTDLLIDLAFMQDFSIETFSLNIANAFTPFFSFSAISNDTYLSPVFGLSTVALILIGALASIGKLFTSRNSVVSLLIIFSIIISGINIDTAISITVPIAILTAAAIESIITKWFSLFPENPYAHILGITPVYIVVIMIVTSGLLHFTCGYHYAPQIAENFTTDIELINKNLEDGTILIVDQDKDNIDFYAILGSHKNIKVYTESPDDFDGPIAYLGRTTSRDNLQLKKIITSPKVRNSDRLYIYEKNIPVETEEGE